MSTLWLVVGAPSGGTSCVAGVLHKLGIFMGHKFVDPFPPNSCMFEEFAVSEMIKEWTERGGEHPQFMHAVGAMRTYCLQNQHREHFGFKYPDLATRSALVWHGFGQMKMRVVYVHRNFEDVHDSILRRWGDTKRKGWIAMGSACMARALWRDIDAESYHVVDYDELVKNPPERVQDIVKMLQQHGHSPTVAQIMDATDWVIPRLQDDVDTGTMPA